MSFIYCYFNYRPDFDYISFLVKELKMNIDELDSEGRSALTICYEEYRKDQMYSLISLGANIDLPCLPGGKTMLLDSFHKGYIDLVEFLFKHGASVECKDKMGKNVHDYIKTEFNGKNQSIKN